MRSDPQPIFTQNGSNDVDSRKDVIFAVKTNIFVTMPPDPLKCQNLSKFSLDFALNSGSQEQTPLILHRSPIKVSQ